MMIKVIQKFSANNRPQECDCESIEDIYNTPFVQRWMDEPMFYRLCKSTATKSNQHLLVVETNEGKDYWVIAYLEGNIDELPLPEWQQK